VLAPLGWARLSSPSPLGDLPFRHIPVFLLWSFWSSLHPLVLVCSHASCTRAATNMADAEHPQEPPQGQPAEPNPLQPFIAALQNPAHAQAFAQAVTGLIAPTLKAQSEQQSRQISRELDHMRFSLLKNQNRHASHRQIHDNVKWHELGGRAKGLEEQREFLTEDAEMHDQVADAIRGVMSVIATMEDDHTICCLDNVDMPDAEGSGADASPSEGASRTLLPANLFAEVQEALNALSARNAERRRVIRLAAYDDTGKGNFALAKEFLLGTPDFTAKELAGYGDFCTKHAKLRGKSDSAGSSPSSGGGGATQRKRRRPHRGDGGGGGNKDKQRGSFQRKKE
jgi:hypothetical protein